MTAYARACLYVGDVRKSASLALALSAKNWPLVQAKESSAGEVPSATKRRSMSRFMGKTAPRFRR